MDTRLLIGFEALGRDGYGVVARLNRRNGEEAIIVGHALALVAACVVLHDDCRPRYDSAGWISNDACEGTGCLIRG